MALSSDPAIVEDQYGLPAGLSSEEAGMYINGLTQTCAALRCRIAELENDNRTLRGIGKDHDPAQEPPAVAAATPAEKLAGGGGGGGVRRVVREDAIMQDMMALMSPPAGVVAERGGGGAGAGGVATREVGFNGGGPRARLSWMSGTPRRGSTAHRESDAFPAPSARTNIQQEEGAARRVSSIPNRARYSVGASRFSLPSNLSPPGPAIASPGASPAKALPRNGPGSVWEGLMLTQPLSGDDKNLAFMEFAVIGVSPSTLAGSHPLQPWGQAAEVLSRFPSAEGSSPAGGEGNGHNSFVQGLGEFCFPSGARIALAEGGTEGTLESVPEDRMHLVQFTDCENVSTYGCCVTVTQVLEDPSPRLVRRLQEREKMHAAARTLQRFMRSALPSASGGGSSNHRFSTPTPKGLGRGASRFRFHTPPPGSGSKLPPGDPSSGGQGSELSPTSFSGMINRFFASNPGAEIDTRVADIGGEVCRPAPAARATAGGAAFSPTRSPSVEGDAGALVRYAGTSAAAAEVAKAAATTGSHSGAHSRRPAASSSPRRRAPSSPCPKTQVSADYSAGGGSQRARSAGYSGGGSGGIKQDVLRAPGYQGVGAEEKSVPKIAPGMFSDDESESDAARSSDTDRDDSFGGGFDNPAASGYSGVRDSGASSAPTEIGARGSGRIGVAGRFDGIAGLDGRKQHPNGSPIRGSGGEEPPSTPPGVTVRSRAASPRDAAGRVGGAERDARMAAAATGAPSWAVLVEKSYVMVSCHRNHPFMFKVLKAVADADRSTRPGAGTSPSPPPPGTVGDTASARTGHGASLSPPRMRPGGGVGGRGNESDDDVDLARKGRSRSASRFRSVAAAAAEEAKGRHRRMLRDKFLHQVRTDKSCTEEGKKVSLHCPGYLRAPLEVASTALELWSTAVLFSCVSEQATLQALDILLLEKTLVVCGRDLGMVSMAATALLSLLDPFKWEGVFVPVVPLTLMDVLDSPVPALVGVQAPFDPHSYAFDGVVVLDLDARQSSGQLIMTGMDEKLPVPEEVVSELKKANTLRGSGGRGAGSSAGRSPSSRNWDSARGDSRSPKALNAASTSNWRVGGRRRRGRTGGASSATSSSSMGPRSHFAFQASTFMAGLTPEEKGTVMRLRSLVKGHVCSLCGDLGVSEMWRKYGAFNSATKNFDFHPDWFTEPLEARLRFQVGVARTQMFVSFVERCRHRDSKITEEDGEDPNHEPDVPADRQQQQQPFAETNLDCTINKEATGLQRPPPSASNRHFQAPSEGAALPASVAVRVRANGAGEGMGTRRGTDAVVSPPPLTSRGRV